MPTLRVVHGMNMDVSRKPPQGFRRFLEDAERDGWLSSFRWAESESLKLLRDKLGGKSYPDLPEGISRTHKRSTDGIWYGLEVEADYGTTVGCDLEILMSRPILDNPQWIINKLHLPRNFSQREILEEWSCRESAFKALSLAEPDLKLNLGQFRRTSPTSYTVFTPKGDRLVQTRAAWAGSWLLSLAWRSLS